MRSPRRVVFDWIVKELTRPRGRYRRFAANDPDALRRHIRKGDVLLVDGEQRISQAIKTLTMSSWSHNAVYIGDELVRRNHPAREAAERRFGREASSLLVEALLDEGVVVSPLMKYADFNIRICRPHGLHARDLDVVMDDLLARIGQRYDVRSAFDLLRYLLPFHLVPVRFREDALHLGSREATETICSTMTAEAFGRVGFPIVLDIRPRRPATTLEKVTAQILGRPSRRAYTGVFRARHPRLVVPRDFDLSPYFDIIKFNVISDGNFDYRAIRWKRPVLPARREHRA